MSTFKSTAATSLVLPLSLTFISSPSLGQQTAVAATDGGHRAWVRQVLPILWGRKARNCNEVEVWAQLATQMNRPEALAVMMKQPDFTEHWAEVLIDLLRVHKEVDFPNGNPILPVEPQNGCFGDPKLTGLPTSVLAEHVLTQDGSNSAPGAPWNMSDLIRSSIELDDLRPVMLANLYAMMDRTYNGNFSEQAQRDLVGLHFGEVYLGRRLSCLGCHNSDWSTSDAPSGWDRHHPQLGSFERAIYGSPSGLDPADFHTVFHPGGYDTSADGPWGMTSCGNAVSTVPDPPGSAFFGGAIDATPNVADLYELLVSGMQNLTNGLDRSVPASVENACNQCQATCSGVTPLDPMTVTNADQVRAMLTSTDPSGPNCGSCHGAELDLWFVGHSPNESWFSHLIGVPSVQSSKLRVEPGNADESFLMTKLDPANGPGTMPPPGSGQPLTQNQLQTVEQWINALQPAHACATCSTLDCSGAPTQVAADEAFAYLTATRLTDAIRQVAAGSGLTVAHGFSRTPGQGDELLQLSENVFIPSGWSLRTLLTRILTSAQFNKQMPAADADTPYDLPMVFDPWVWADPREPDYDSSIAARHYNAVSDGVKRYPARTLLKSISSAWGWPAPPRLPSDDTYPTKQFNLELGQRFSDSNPESRAIDLGGLLAWEATLGQCVAPTARGDWFSQLQFFLTAWNGPPLTLAQALGATKDRLLSYSTFQKSEQQALESLIGKDFKTLIQIFSPPNSASITPAQAVAAARKTCGVLASSPQFLLAGIAPNYACTSNPIQICNGSEPCSFEKICESLQDDVGEHLVLQCGQDSLDVNMPADTQPELCPDRLCGLIPWPVDHDCLRQPLACVTGPPQCDPRCTHGPGCCGPTPWRQDLEQLLVWWGDDLTIEQATGLMHHAVDGSRPRPLTTRTRLAYGDLLVAQPGASIRARRGRTRVVDATTRTSRLIVVSGKRALVRPRSPQSSKVQNEASARWMVQHGWIRGTSRPKNSRKRGVPEEVRTYVRPRPGTRTEVDVWRAKIRKAQREKK